MKDIINIKEDGSVKLSDERIITLDMFLEKSNIFFGRYIAGFTTIPDYFINYYSRSTDSKGLENLVRNSKREGYLEAVQGKFWTPRNKIAVGAIITIAVVGVFLLIMAKQSGLLNF